MVGDGSGFDRAISDDQDCLTEADEPIAGLQLCCGGQLPGTIAVPSLLELVRKARHYKLKLARPISASNSERIITAWVEVGPRQDGASGCEMIFCNWHSIPIAPEDPEQSDRRSLEIDRHVAELTARLDERQNLLVVQSSAADLAQLNQAMQAGLGRPWTDFVTLELDIHQQPVHWRLLDGTLLFVPGSERKWRARLLPRCTDRSRPDGFELLLTALEPLPQVSNSRPSSEPKKASKANEGSRSLLGRDIAPVLRQPLSRIIANAETIRTRLAGPIPDKYAEYAADISAAGRHLLTMLADLSDLEVVESDDFTTAADCIDLADVARQAAGILNVRAGERGISIDAPRLGETLPAIAEFRRVLQVLLNLIGNAIRYSPAESQVWVRLERAGDRARVIVADQGQGLSLEQQARVFEKFERLGRSGDGGSGLGLFISRRLAQAMGGSLTVESAPGQGARFILEVPAGPEGSQTSQDGSASLLAGTDKAGKLPTIPNRRQSDS